jgi:hypothetical protein
LAVAAQTKKAIKPYLWNEVDKQVFEARFKLFSVLQVPRYVDYDTFLESLNQDVAMGFDWLQNEAKTNITRAT